MYVILKGHKMQAKYNWSDICRGEFQYVKLTLILLTKSIQ